MLLVIAVPEQLATSRLAGMPPITGFYAFVAGTVAFALLGSSPQISVGADSTIAPLFATGVSALALTGSPHYVELVGILAVMVGLMVMLVSILRLGWIAEFLSTPIVTGFLSGVAVIIIIHQLPDFLGLPPTTGSNPHRVTSVFKNLGQANAWTVVDRGGRPGRHVRLRPSQSAHPRWPDRPRWLHGARGGPGSAGARCRRPRDGQEWCPPFRTDRVVMVHARESGTPGGGGCPGHRDPDGGDDPGLCRSGWLRRERRARLLRCRRRQRAGRSRRARSRSMPVRHGQGPSPRPEAVHRPERSGQRW